jgi:hypothetical protein
VRRSLIRHVQVPALRYVIRARHLIWGNCGLARIVGWIRREIKKARHLIWVNWGSCELAPIVNSAAELELKPGTNYGQASEAAWILPRIRRPRFNAWHLFWVTSAKQVVRWRFIKPLLLVWRNVVVWFDPI